MEQFKHLLAASAGRYRTGETPDVGDIVDGARDGRAENFVRVEAVRGDDLDVRPIRVPVGIRLTQAEWLALPPSSYYASCCNLVRRGPG